MRRVWELELSGSSGISSYLLDWNLNCLVQVGLTFTGWIGTWIVWSESDSFFFPYPIDLNLIVAVFDCRIIELEFKLL